MLIHASSNKVGLSDADQSYSTETVWIFSLFGDVREWQLQFALHKQQHIIKAVMRV